GAVELGELVAIYLAFRARLPTEVADHVGPTGTPNGWLPPLEVFEASALTLLSIAVVFSLLLLGLARSAALRFHHGSAFARPVLALDGALAVVSIPATLLVLPANAAGATSFSPTTEGGLVTALRLVPVLAALVLLVAGRRQRPPIAHDPRQRAGAYPAFRGVGGPVEFSCGACGNTFVLDGVPIFAPHMAIRGQGSIYLRCPRCGERGWCAVVRRIG
ncbi:MAG: hypothetical protein L3J91_02835, partial [Thermoplasmata archaeon]|nr:hypothetical protein [Thermoplasmata archaeon]